MHARSTGRFGLVMAGMVVVPLVAFAVVWVSLWVVIGVAWLLRLAGLG